MNVVVLPSILPATVIVYVSTGASEDALMVITDVQLSCNKHDAGEKVAETYGGKPLAEKEIF